MAIATAVTGTCQSVYMDGVYFGRAMGASYNDAQGAVHRRGTGGTDQLSSSFFVPGGNIRFYPTDKSTFLKTTGGKIVRAATNYPCSDLTSYDLIFVSEANLEYSDCKTASITLESSVGEALTGSLDFVALGVTEGATKPATPGTPGSLWEWYHAACSVEGVGYSIEGFSVTLENSLTPRSDMDGFTAGQSIRTPKRLFVGDETVRLSVRTKNPIPNSVRGNLEDDLTTDLTFSAAFVSAGSGSLTITVDNLTNMTGENTLEQEDGVTIYTYSFEARICSSALTIAMVAPI